MIGRDVLAYTALIFFSTAFRSFSEETAPITNTIKSPSLAAASKAKDKAAVLYLLATSYRINRDPQYLAAARDPIARSIQLAMQARNREFSTLGVMNVDSALDALLLYRSLSPGPAGLCFEHLIRFQ